METLNQIAQGNDLRANVAQWILDRLPDYDGNIEGVINNLMKGGCISGIVGHLIYYSDTTEFYDKYSSDIWELIEEQADEQGITPMEVINHLNGAESIGSDETFKNLLAWFAFEETARNMAYELGVEV